MCHPAKNIIVGRIIGVHGIRGQVKVYSDCRPRESIFHYRHFSATKDNHEPLILKLLRGTRSGKNLIAHFSGIDEREQAAALTGYILCINRNQLPALKNDEYYWTDLIGLKVQNRQGIILGEVQELFETGANDVLVIRDQQEEILIPFIQKTYIEKIDLNTGMMFVDWEKDWATSAEKEQ